MTSAVPAIHSDVLGRVVAEPERVASEFVGDDLPASARVLARLLTERGPLTHRDLVGASELPARTVRWAVNRLQKQGVVEGRANLRDARQHLYYMKRREAVPPEGARRPLALGGW